MDKKKPDLSEEQALLLEHDGIMVMAEDIRQYVYCKRILYFRHVMGIWPIKTYKMERGEEIHEQKARKRGVDIQGAIETYHNIWLQSVKLGYGALLDAFEFTGSEIYPVEIKSGHGPGEPDNRDLEHHKYQFIAQALLLEEAFDMLVSRARVRYVDAGVDYFVPITFDDRQMLLKLLKDIRETIRLEIFPEPTIHAGKCVDCEFWGYCLHA
nr:CRISPR-associated protein Cas4 [Candidatus Sigynarchaeota archaeon]